MAGMKCPSCGAMCVFKNGQYICESCWNVYDAEENGDVVNNKLNLANEKRNGNYDFDGALKLCKEVLNIEPNNQGALWGALLAEYQIVYLENESGKFAPTFLDPASGVPIPECTYYAQLNYGFKCMADDIEKIRLLAESGLKSVEKYDVFISYKQHTGNGTSQETQESVWAEKIYKLLSRNTGNGKLRVFYDKQSLKSGYAGWEPHIYSALKSAKVMIILGSSVENINSTWVKNEWKRFLRLREKDPTKTFMVVGNNFVSNLAPELKSQQFISVDDNWEDIVVENVNNYFGSVKNLDYLFEEANSYIRKGNFKKAKNIYNEILRIDKSEHRAYWGLLRCDFKAFDNYDLVKSSKDITKNEYYRLACKCAAEKNLINNKYIQVSKDRLTHKTENYERKNYKIYLQLSKSKKIIIKAISAVIAVAVCGMGIFIGLHLNDKHNSEVASHTALLIENIGEITAESEQNIVDAETSYASLSNSQKEKVHNYSDLVDARAIYNVIKEINELPATINRNSNAVISSAEQAYKNLDDDLKILVSNHYKLLDARNICDVDEELAKCGIVNLYNKNDGELGILSCINLADVLNNKELCNDIVGITLNDFISVSADKWKGIFTNLDTIEYDVSEGTSVTSMSFNASVVTYRVKGGNEALNVKLSAVKGKNLKLKFENFKTQAEGTALDLSAIDKGELAFFGSCTFTGGKACSAVTANDLTLSLGNGADVMFCGGEGTSEKSGGIGIFAQNLTISGAQNTNITVKGGNGIDGVDGTNGIDGINGPAVSNQTDRSKRAGGNGTNGTDGTAGTNGGEALNVSSLNVNSVSCTFVGGNGGSGGSGGNGGNGGNGAGGSYVFLTAYHRAGYGGRGGNGGNGGNGGRGGSAIQITNAIKTSVIIDGSTVTLETGKCGNGGNGGRGGNGGNGGTDDWYDNCPKSADGGNGGNSGSGGSCYKEQTQSDLSNMITAKDSGILYVTADKSAIAGEAGTNGKGGKGGPAYGHTPNPGEDGAGGKPGQDGQVLSR